MGVMHLLVVVTVAVVVVKHPIVQVGQVGLATT
jgi:hypothetical protein